MSAAALLRRIGTALLLVVLAGCGSTTRLVYDNGATLLRWRATSYLDVHGAQAKDLDQRIESFLDWHRRHALPQYAQIADSGARRIERGLTRADLEWGYDAFRAQLAEGLRVAARSMAPLLDSLTAEQTAHLAQRMTEDNEKFKEEYLSGGEPDGRARRARRNVKRLEEWFGPLSEAQRAEVARYSERAPLTDALRAQDRLRRQAELLAIVRTKSAHAKLEGWAVGWDEGRAPAYATAARAQREAFFDMLLAIERRLSDEQRKRVAGRFREFAQDFAILALAGTAGAQAR